MQGVVVVLTYGKVYVVIVGDSDILEISLDVVSFCGVELNGIAVENVAST